MALSLKIRPRRNRKSHTVREMLAETNLTIDQMVLPVFLTSGTKKKDPIG
ncbi:MAG: porphobilinogen synthase, partial [Pseudobdellovibrionaceae bacterium]